MVFRNALFMKSATLFSEKCTFMKSATFSVKSAAFHHANLWALGLSPSIGLSFERPIIVLNPFGNAGVTNRTKKEPYISLVLLVFMKSGTFHMKSTCAFHCSGAFHFSGVLHFSGEKWYFSWKQTKPGQYVCIHAPFTHTCTTKYHQNIIYTQLAFPVYSMKDQVKMRDLCWISCFCCFSGAFHVVLIKSTAFHMKSSSFHENQQKTGQIPPNTTKI